MKPCDASQITSLFEAVAALQSDQYCFNTSLGELILEKYDRSLRTTGNVRS